MPLRLFLLTVFLFALPQLSIAQNPKDIDWQKGWIEFNDGRRQTCELSFSGNTVAGTVLVRKGNKVIAYPPAKVSAFSFNGREFLSLPIFDLTQKVQRPYFLELLFEGELISFFTYTLEVDRELQKPKVYSFLLLMNMKTGVIDYYTMLKAGYNPLYSYPTSKMKVHKDLLFDLMDNARSMKKYIKSNSLSLKDQNDVITILTRYHKEKNKGFYTPGQKASP